eukprot:10262835-Alexandrium_andersonii.AAC.1
MRSRSSSLSRPIDRQPLRGALRSLSVARRWSSTCMVAAPSGRVESDPVGWIYLAWTLRDAAMSGRT